MNHFFRTRCKAFQHAFSGLYYVLRKQRNAWIHMILTLLVLLAGFWLNISIQNWMILILTIGMVWTAEILNTSLEVTIDIISPDYHPLAKVGKDVGAAAVLIASISAIVVGLLVLGPPLIDNIRLLFY
ncbi:MAG: diacylglycerol kinase family protein [Anaerolineaceae bacterium]